MNDHTQIAIIGGGLCGLSAAYVLAEQGWTVTLLEAKPAPNNSQQDGRALALNAGSQQWLAAHDLWPENLAKAAQPLRQIHISARGHFGCVKLRAQQHQLDAFGVVVAAEQLQHALWQQVSNHPNIHCIHQATLTAIKANGELTYTHNGKAHRLTTDLCIAADGSHSKTAQLLDLPLATTPSDHHALIMKVNCATPHQGRAYQRFLGTQTLAFLPSATDPHAGTLVLTLPQTAFERWQAADLPKLEDKLQQDFGWRLGRLQLQPQRFSYSVLSQRLNQTICERVVFIGNAAQTLPPVAAQGFNLGLRDVATLAQHLKQTHSLNPATWQQAYQQQRQADRQRTQQASGKLLTAFVPGTPLHGLGLTALSCSALGQDQLVNAAAQAWRPTHNQQQSSAGKRVIIVGAGICGLSLAARLAQAGIDVQLLDRRPPPCDAGDPLTSRVSAISPDNWQFLTQLGITPPAHANYHRMQVWDQGGSLEFDTLAQPFSQLGTIVSNQALCHALWQLLSEHPRISFLGNCTPQTLEQSDQQMLLTCQQGTLTADLVIGCDGKRSWVRDQAAIGCEQYKHQQTAITTTIQLNTPHQFTAWQHFMPSGPLAILPLPDPRQAAIVWSADTAEANRLLELESAQFVAALNRALEQKLNVTEMLQPHQHFPLVSQHAQRYYTPGMVLAGDAAHTIHPLAGQGLNLGLRDVQALANLLIDASNDGFASPSTLRRYQRQRRGNNAHILSSMCLLQAVFGRSDASLLSKLRGHGLNTINYLPPLKHWLSQQATQ